MSVTPETFQNLQAPLTGVVLVVLVDYLRQHQGWGWMRLIAGASAFRQVPGLRFVKVMGSGQGGGFSLRPSPSHQGLICNFASWSEAAQFLQSPLVKSACERAREWWYGIFAVQSARGEWDQQAWAVTDPGLMGAPGVPAAHPQMLGVLTRASIRPAKAVAFWRHAPAAQAELTHADGCNLSMGLGEAPLLRQCTFSLWRDTECMTRYAHHNAHQTAIQAAYRHQFFNESLFVRMQLLFMRGTWTGQAFEYGAALEPEPAHD